mmetsp:Transcript_1256/g.1914  ORF Transcript_1256/g.1914 Transcript_1256/m.1914 type:complete len:695 (+) Transcript_1256:90-2174(+)
MMKCPQHALSLLGLLCFTACHGFVLVTHPSSSRSTTTRRLALDYDFERLLKIDQTIQELKKQLPNTLTKSLDQDDNVYAKDVQLTVLVLDEDDNDEPIIRLLQSKDELLSLSNVLVLATTAAMSFGSGESSTNNNNNVVQCQLIIDESLKAIRIPWKTKVLGSLTNTIEGLSEFVLNADTGQIQSHCIRSVTWNGQAMNGPAIGRALRATQSAVENLQQSPLVQTFLSGSTLLREGLLEQVATASTGRLPLKTNPPKVIFVKEIQNITSWIDEINNDTRIITPKIPFPGSEDWKSYSAAYSSKVNFCEQVIPMLTDGSSGVADMEQIFDSNVTFSSVDGSLLMNGNAMVSNFFRSLALARVGMGGSWTLNDCSLVEGWNNQTTVVRVDYQASLPPTWTIQGRDCYILSNNYEEMNQHAPKVLEIRQEKFSAADSSGSLILDNPWFMKNLVSALELQVGNVDPNVQEILSEMLLRQGGGRTRKPRLTTTKKLSQSSAANVYYIMSDLQDSFEQILRNTNETTTTVPAIDLVKDDVELVGYLGEPLLRGSQVYRRVMRTILSTLQQAMTQKILLLERNKVQVELSPQKYIRLSLTLMFRLNPPSIFPTPDSSVGGVPLKLELVSDYKIDVDTGLVSQHRFVATRINGQLTPGDVASRWIQQFLKLEKTTDDNLEDDLQRGISDTLAWLLRSSAGGF